MGRTYKEAGKVLPYTNPSASTAIAVDTVIVLPTGLAVALDAIAASAVGSISMSGVHDLPALSTDAWEMNDPLWWDASAAKLTRLGLPGLAFAGLAAAAKLVTSGVRATVRLNDRGNLPECMLGGRTYIDTAVDLTLTAAGHSGGVIRVTADAKTVTLPTGVAGMDFVVQNAALDGAALLTVDLDGTEIIAGANLSIANGKTAVNAKATAKRGDYLHLVCNVAATSWRVVSMRGTWATT